MNCCAVIGLDAMGIGALDDLLHDVTVTAGFVVMDAGAAVVVGTWIATT